MSLHARLSFGYKNDESIDWLCTRFHYLFLAASVDGSTRKKNDGVCFLCQSAPRLMKLDLFTPQPAGNSLSISVFLLLALSLLLIVAY